MILNLANLGDSTIKYDLISFPDGHKHVNLKDLHTHLYVHDTVTIKTRVKTYDDVFIIKQAVSQMRDVRSDLKISLMLAYLLAGRYDRPMHEHDSFDLKIVCDDINALNFNNVIVVEPHSNVTTTLLNNAIVQYPLNGVLKNTIEIEKNLCFAVPDLGAVKRVENLLSWCKQDLPIVYCNKHRNLATGEILGIQVFNPENLRRHVIIYDDLCDGGMTFIKLAEKLRKCETVEEISLFVTHGLFSKGVDVLVEDTQNHIAYVDHVYTTNSFQEQKDSTSVSVTKVI